MYSRNTVYWHLFAVFSDTFVIKFNEYESRAGFFTIYFGFYCSG